MNLPQIQKILQEFEKQSEIMDMKEEIMNDAIDDAMEDEGDEEERYKTFLYIYINILCQPHCSNGRLLGVRRSIDSVSPRFFGSYYNSS